ncbi:MAG TPA: DUF547 domain-containing protein [Vicinamibacterales bacterium]|nr:DUF547 domain-containing protein [Vicinamibacterales bacterium]
MRVVSLLVVALSACVCLAAAPQAPLPEPGVDALHRPLDQLLDGLVRDGLVYYHALKTERGRLDRYVASLNVPAATYGGWTRDQQVAFWIDAYNAFVLETVIDHYPIRGRSPEYPASSIRQIPGAFDRTVWRAAGRSVTLDQIEKSILPAFDDPRVYLALGRGAVGSGRLHSEAYTAAHLAQQLASVQAEFVTNQQMLRIDRAGRRISVTPIVSWNDHAFIAAYDKDGDPAFASRSPIERAILAFIRPNLLPIEQDFVHQNQFTMTFHDFDWHLNDLTGR